MIHALCTVCWTPDIPGHACFTQEQLIEFQKTLLERQDDELRQLRRACQLNVDAHLSNDHEVRQTAYNAAHAALKATDRCWLRRGDWLEDREHESGDYLCHCITCHRYFHGHKRRFTCKLCSK